MLQQPQQVLSSQLPYSLQRLCSSNFATAIAAAAAVLQVRIPGNSPSKHSTNIQHVLHATKPQHSAAVAQLLTQAARPTPTRTKLANQLTALHDISSLYHAPHTTRY
jgi:hypothetical protein